MNKSFDVFLSHNSKDKPAVRALAEALQGRGLKVWLDEWELVPGRPWQEALEEVIEITGASAVLVGKDGLGPWQDAEMRSCLAEFVRLRDLRSAIRNGVWPVLRFEVVGFRCARSPGRQP